MRARVMESATYTVGAIAKLAIREETAACGLVHLTLHGLISRPLMTLHMPLRSALTGVCATESLGPVHAWRVSVGWHVREPIAQITVVRKGAA